MEASLVLTYRNGRIESKAIEGQGDPLYNADLLDIQSEPNQLTIAYVDNAILYASGNNFEEMHETLANLMTKENSIINWLEDHNSPLEYTKLALINFSHHSWHIIHPNLKLPHGNIEPKNSIKYLRVVLDQHLLWAPQHTHVIKKGTHWTSQIKHIVHPGWGITPKYARRLYISIALPRVLYGAEVWYMPSGESTTGRKPKGCI